MPKNADQTSDSEQSRRFAYYDRLDAAGKRTYRKSDAITAVPLADAGAVRPLVATMRDALATGERAAVQRTAERVCRAILRDLDVGPIDLEVLEARPRGDYGELHGLYTWESGARPRIQVWMRTAAKARIVAWKSFLRTLLHEIGHHLDLNYFGLAETFHTRGFYARETSLYEQIGVGLPEPAAAVASVPVVVEKAAEEPAPVARDARPRQLTIPGFE